MTHEEAIERAVKLLKLARSDNAHEAALAAARAQEVIDKYKLGHLGLTSEDPAGEAPMPEEPIKDFKGAPMAEGKQLLDWHWRLAIVIANANQCELYVTSRWVGPGYANDKRKGIAIVGRPSDAETVRYMFEWLSHEVDRLADRDGKGMGRTWRNNFRLGVVDTIRTAFIQRADATRAEARADAKASVNPNALVRVENAIVKMAERHGEVKLWVNQNLKLRRVSIGGRSNYEQTARDAGREAGKEIEIGGARAGLGSGTKALP